MKQIQLHTTLEECQMDELSADERHLIDLAIEQTSHSYAPYSHFCVGAAVRLEDGHEVVGCNQENAAYPSGLCAERTALFAAGAMHPDKAVTMLAIAARGTDGELLSEPVSPCGACRQVIVESETRGGRKIVILLYGTRHVYRINGIGQLMPLTFNEIV